MFTKIPGKKGRIKRHGNNNKLYVTDVSEVPTIISKNQKKNIEIICIKKNINYEEVMKNIKTWDEADKYIHKYNDILTNT